MLDVTDQRLDACFDLGLTNCSKRQIPRCAHACPWRFSRRGLAIGFPHRRPRATVKASFREFHRLRSRHHCARTISACFPPNIGCGEVTVQACYRPIPNHSNREKDTKDNVKKPVCHQHSSTKKCIEIDGNLALSRIRRL